MKATEGRWVTIKGTRIFIENGQSVGDAIKSRKKRIKTKEANEKRIIRAYKKADQMSEKGDILKRDKHEKEALAYIFENRKIASMEKPGRYKGGDCPSTNPYYQQHVLVRNGVFNPDQWGNNDPEIKKENTENMKEAIRLGMSRDKNRGKLRSPIFASEKKRIKKK